MIRKKDKRKTTETSESKTADDNQSRHLIWKANNCLTCLSLCHLFSYWSRLHLCHQSSHRTSSHLCNGHPACFHSGYRQRRGHRCTDRWHLSFFFQVSTSSTHYPVSPFVGLRATSMKRCVCLRRVDSCRVRLLETSPECSVLFVAMHPTNKDGQPSEWPVTRNVHCNVKQLTYTAIIFRIIIFTGISKNYYHDAAMPKYGNHHFQHYHSPWPPPPHQPHHHAHDHHHHHHYCKLKL